MDNQADNLSPLKQATEELIYAVKLKTGKILVIDEDIFSSIWCTNQNLIRKNFQVGKIFLSPVDIENGTSEDEMMDTALTGTLIEQIKRLTYLVLEGSGEKNIIAIIDDELQRHSNYAHLKIVLQFSDNKAELCISKFYSGFIWGFEVNDQNFFWIALDS
jgi:hypothetical protein